MRPVAAVAVVAISVAGSGGGCDCAGSEGRDQSGVGSDGTVVSFVSGDPFLIQIERDGVLVGTSATVAGCPPLLVGLRLSTDNDSWIDPQRADVTDAVEVLSASRGTAVGDDIVVDLEDGRGQRRGQARVVAREGAEGFVDVDVEFQDEDGVALDERDVGFVGACFAMPAGDHAVGGGERFDGADLTGKITPLVFSAPGNTESGTNEAHVPVPFMATTRGLGVLVETERVGAIDATIDGAVMVRFHGTTLPLRLRAARLRGAEDGHPERVTDNVAAHARRMGLPRAPPRWALAPMQWRNDLEVDVDDGVIVSTGSDMLRGDIDALRERQLPFSTVWIDAPWETGYNTFVVNETQLPSFDDDVATLAAHGIVPLVWATEHVNTSDDSDQMVGMPPFGSQGLFDEFNAAGFLVQNDDGSAFTFPWGRGDGTYVDFTNADACAAWQAHIVPVLRRGVRGFKLDYGETMRPDILGLVANSLPVFSDGTTTAVQHTRYARLYHECYIGALQQVHGDDWFIITRTGGIFDQKNGVTIWPGDLDGDFTGLGEINENGERRVGGIKSGIAGALSCAMSGYPLYGHDVGGYRGPTVTPEAFARWAEAGALQTIMQVGGGSNHAPWDDFLLDVEDAFARAARLKMALWPMYEAGLQRAMGDGDGTPLMVPLGVYMGDDAEAWADAYAMVLFDIVAAYPVVEDGARERAVRVPQGRWFDLNTPATGAIEGPATKTMPAPLGSPPMLLRAGASLILDEESHALLPTTIAGRVGLSPFRVVVTGPGAPSVTSAGGLVVRQNTDDAGTVTVAIERTGDALVGVRVFGVFADVSADGTDVDVLNIEVDGGRTVCTVGGSGDVTVTFTP
jgi:alpha-D-xyloside xylohydrolase